MYSYKFKVEDKEYKEGTITVNFTNSAHAAISGNTSGNSLTDVEIEHLIKSIQDLYDPGYIIVKYIPE